MLLSMGIVRYDTREVREVQDKGLVLQPLSSLTDFLLSGLVM